ncbi:TauD-domain-containing protein [Clavulina sp. PMI_390]|nr:TauD-domain-containing protein [Clavulina sp. PMI_390]
MVPPVALTDSSTVILPVVEKLETLSFNPFYSNIPPQEENDSYEHAKYKPVWPKVDWEPLTEFTHVDVGLRADPEKKSLFSAASKVDHLTPAIGTKLEGLDLRHLTDAQKDELALLVAERTVVVFDDQEISIEEQLELARHFGTLHKHATTGMPAGLEEVHVVYTDGRRPPDSTAFSKVELYHSDVTYELQPPGTTSLKVITAPETGGDTIWSSGYALYSSLSAPMQTYLEGLTALHSGVAQAVGSRSAGTHVRRHELETVHPVVRVHPVTGWKSVFVNPGFTRKIIGIPKAESDAILDFLFAQLSNNPDFQVRIRWKKNTIVFWDNRVATHSAIFDFFPERRHALRATPHGERPLSVAEYEKLTGKQAKDRQKEVWKSLGYDPDAESGDGVLKAKKIRGYND